MKTISIEDKRDVCLGFRSHHGNLGIILETDIKRSAFREVRVRVHVLPTVRKGEPLIELEEVETLVVSEIDSVIDALLYAKYIATIPDLLTSNYHPIPGITIKTNPLERYIHSEEEVTL